MRRITDKLLSSSATEVALAWAKEGIPVLALWGVSENGRCDCGQDCESPGKHPIGSLFPRGHLSATTDPIKIRSAFRKYPNANLGIVPKGDLVVLDVDGEDGAKTYKGLRLPETAHVITGRGRHHYFIERDQVSSLPAKLRSIDIKAGGRGYVVVPPSRHASGKRYRWSKHQRVLAPLPHTGFKPPHRVRVDFGASRYRTSQGSRNSTLTKLAGYLRYQGLVTEQISAALTTLNRQICDPHLDEEEVRRIAASVGRYESGNETAFGSMADVQEEDVEWVGYPYLIRGATTVLDGNPGQGKSTFVIAIAAAITRGRNLPFMPDLQSGSVLILSAEDDPARVLKPRLLAHHADVGRVRFQKEPFSLDTRGLTLLRSEIEQHRPILVVIDPLIAYMDSDTDLHKANETMRFMIELDLIAREFNLAMLVVRHLRKSDSDDPLHRGLGSIAISARVRSLLVLARHPSDRQLRAVAQAKCSYAPEAATILFRLVPTKHNKPPKIEWAGKDEHLTAESLLSKPRDTPGRPDNEREAAKNFLEEFLARGERSLSDIQGAAAEKSITYATLRRAARELGIKKPRRGRNTVWALP